MTPLRVSLPRLPRRWPIGLKLFALIAAVAVIPLVIGFALSYREGKRILLEQGIHHLDAHAEQLGRQIDAFFAERLSAARGLAEDEVIRRGLGRALPAWDAEQRLGSLLRSHPELIGVSLVDRSGAVRRSAGQKVLEHADGRTFFTRALEGSPAVSRPFLEGGRPILAFASPVKNEGEEVAGVIVVYTPAEELWKIVEEARDRVIQGSVAIISDRNGIRLAHSTRRDLIFRSWAPLPEKEARDLLSRRDLGSDVSAVPATDLDDVHKAVREAQPPRQLKHRLVIGGTYHSVLVPLRGTDWIVIHSFPEEGLLAPLQELRRQFALYLALVLAVAVAVSLAATWYALRPVRLLTGAAERVRAGDLTVAVDLNQRDEIGAFARTFNEMIRQIAGDREALSWSLKQVQLLQEYYEEIIREATVVVFLIGADGRVRHANRKAEEVLGYAADELAGMTCDALQAVQSERFHRRIARMFEERGKIEREEILLRARDGGIRHLVCTLSTLTNPQGEPEAAVFGLDVTEERHLQEKWERIEKLASLGQLAAGAAHEMKNYLTPILGYTDLICHRGKIAGEDRQDVERIVKSAKGLERLVKQLAGCARPSKDKMEPVDVSSVIEEVLAFLQKDLARKQIAVDLLVEPVPPVLADQGALEQVFLNLILNAVQAMSSGGTLRVKAAPCPDGSVEVDIADTGPGIPEETLPRLFTPFFTTKPASEGTGLGLFICRQILERMGSRIDVRSRPGEGATFMLRLVPAR